MKSSGYSTIAALVALVVMALSGCNTMKGIGKDVERGGERVQDAAQSTQNKM